MRLERQRELEAPPDRGDRGTAGLTAAVIDHVFPPRWSVLILKRSVSVYVVAVRGSLETMANEANVPVAPVRSVFTCRRVCVYVQSPITSGGFSTVASGNRRETSR